MSYLFSKVTKRKRSEPSVSSKKTAGKPAGSAIMPIGKIEQAILLVRGEKVILDADLSKLYGVPTKRLNEQVKRNIDRFPEDFMFQLTWEEGRALRSQDVTSRGGRNPTISRSQNATSKRRGGR